MPLLDIVQDMSAVIRAGASGFSYKEWLGGFYPSKLPAIKMLPYYAERLPTVEINYTFRAMPRRAMLEGWAAKTPPTFRFALKASQRITHFAKLRGVEDNLNYFIDTAKVLGERLGPILFQLPPDLRRDDELLKDFIAQLDRRVQAAFEFRHTSWFDDAVMELLRSGRAALCIAETDKMVSPIVSTAEYVYLRLRKIDYDDMALSLWAERIQRLADIASEVYIYFKHEAAAPSLARKMLSLLGQP